MSKKRLSSLEYTMKSSKRNLISNEDNEINSDEESPIVLVSREEMEDQILEDLEEQQWDEEIDNVALRMDEMEIIHETEENFETTRSTINMD